MAVLQVLRENKGRGYHTDSDGNLTAVRVWRVLTDDPQDEGAVLTEAVDPTTGVRIPSLSERYTPDEGGIGPGAGTDDYLTVRAKDAKPDGSSMTNHLVTVSYAAIAGGNAPISPLAKTPRWSWTTIGMTREIVYDAEGKRVLNTAGVEYDPAPAVDYNMTQLSVSWNSWTYNPQIMANYASAINSEPFTCKGMLGYVVGARRAKITGWTLNNELDWSRPYVSIGLTMLMGGNPFVPLGDAGPHDLVLASFSLTQLVDGVRTAVMVQDTTLDENGVWRPVWKDPPANTDPKMIRSQIPMPLDLAGKQVEPGADAADTLFKPYVSLPFGLLRIPT